MKTALFSLLIAISVALLSLFQFEKYQTLSQQTQITFSKLENEMKSKVEDLDNSVRLLKGQDQAILTQLKVNTWGQAEVDYLVTLASIELETQRNPNLVLQLLTKAQSKLQQLDDPSLDSLNEALTTDVTNLKNLAMPDRRMLWLRVSTLMDEASRLSPQQSLMKAIHQAPQKAEPKETSTDSSWKTLMQEGLDNLKGLVKVQRHSKPVEPILPQMEQVLVRENLRLLLEQVRLAIMSRDNEIFYKAIQEAHDWLSTYYEESQKEVRNVQHSLYALSKMNLSPPLPQLTSPAFLKDLREKR